MIEKKTETGEPEHDWSGPYEFYEQAGPRELKLKRRHWVLGQAGGARYGVAFVFGDDDGPVKLLAASHDLAAALEARLAIDREVAQSPLADRDEATNARLKAALAEAMRMAEDALEKAGRS